MRDSLSAIRNRAVQASHACDVALSMASKGRANASTWLALASGEEIAASAWKRYAGAAARAGLPPNAVDEALRNCELHRASSEVAREHYLRGSA